MTCSVTRRNHASIATKPSALPAATNALLGRSAGGSSGATETTQNVDQSGTERNVKSRDHAPARAKQTDHATAPTE